MYKRMPTEEYVECLEELLDETPEAAIKNMCPIADYCFDNFDCVVCVEFMKVPYELDEGDYPDITCPCMYYDCDEAITLAREYIAEYKKAKRDG